MIYMVPECTGIAVIQDHKILLGWRADGQGWSMAGGKVEKNETIAVCAKRELFEEFGLVANQLIYRGQVTSQAYLKGTLQTVKPHIFLCYDYDGKVQINIKEMEDYRWFPLPTIEKLEPLFLPTKEALSLIR